ncbi:hypothetical protein ACDQ55_19815 [Chitinophaga sp. 30R24]|uniref:hypothetical protein n=1 Tax=Chitinophaga sp. 30R24 TaxID=3248838 RepID=UPI003B9073D8
MFFTTPSQSADTQQVLQAVISAEHFDETLQDATGAKPAHLTIAANGLFDVQQQLTWDGARVTVIPAPVAENKVSCLDVQTLHIGKKNARLYAYTANGKLIVKLNKTGDKWEVKHFYFRKKRKMVWDANF